MTDGVIKGTGNSRYLKTVPNALTLYPDWPTALQAMVDGTFPVDFNGINPNGWTTQGTKLSKANLLTDAVANALALTGEKTPTQAFEKLRQLVSTAQSTANSAPKISFGSYIGTGVYGTDNPNSITFPFVPIVAWIYGWTESQYPTRWGTSTAYYTQGTPFMVSGNLTTGYDFHCGFASGDNRSDCKGKKSSNGKTFYWYGEAKGYQLNENGIRYFWVAFG